MKKIKVGDTIDIKGIGKNLVVIDESSGRIKNERMILIRHPREKSLIWLNYFFDVDGSLNVF